MGTKHTGPEEERRALDAFITLTRATNSVLTTLARSRSYGSLSVSQFGVLEALYHVGPLSQTDLARKVLRSTANLVTVIDNLERRGLVRRARLERDRRVMQVSLTAGGRGLIEDLLPDHVGTIVSAMSALEPEEQRALTGLCRNLGLSQRQRQLQGGEKSQ